MSSRFEVTEVEPEAEEPRVTSEEHGNIIIKVFCVLHNFMKF